MSASFTPGPWMIFDDADRFEIAVGLLGENRICEPLGDIPEQAEANGYLIAAAPELYEALAKFVEHCTFDTLCKGDNLDNLFGDAKAALAKARGETA